MFLTSFSPVVRGTSIAERLFQDVWHSQATSYDARPVAQANIHANEDQVTVAMQVPNIDVASLECSVHGDQLTISGRPVPNESAPASEAKAPVWLRRERSQGAFERSFQLPYTVDPEQTSATVRDGILSVTLHRHQADRPRRIVVTAA